MRWPAYTSLSLGGLFFAFWVLRAGHLAGDADTAAYGPALLIAGSVFLAGGLLALQAAWGVCCCTYDDQGGCDCDHCDGCKGDQCCGKCGCS